MVCVICIGWVSVWGVYKQWTGIVEWIIFIFVFIINFILENGMLAML